MLAGSSPPAPGGVTSTSTVHTPPEGSVRAKKKYITFDTNFGRYLPRGTIIDGSRKCRMGAFCTIAKISGEMPKKGLKTGQNGVKFFLGPSHMLNRVVQNTDILELGSEHFTPHLDRPNDHLQLFRRLLSSSATSREPP